MSLEPFTNPCVVEDEEFHHIKTVYRNKEGDILEITNGKGTLARMKIENIDKKKATLSLLEKQYYPRIGPNIAIAFSLLRNKNDEWIVEKLTELGVRDFFPMHTRYTVRKEKDNTQERFSKTAIAAMKQCDHAWLPTIHDTQSMKTTIEILKANGYIVLVASEWEGGNNISDILPTIEGPIAFMIGPEGGFSEEERQMIESERLQRYSLGNHILRAETAAVSSASLIINYCLAINPQYY